MSMFVTALLLAKREIMVTRLDVLVLDCMIYTLTNHTCDI